MVVMARSRISTSSGSTSRMPRGGAVSSLGSRVTVGGRSLTSRRSPSGRARRHGGRGPALLLGQRHDQLRLAGHLEEVLVADDGGDQRRLATVLAGNAAERANHAVEA